MDRPNVSPVKRNPKGCVVELKQKIMILNHFKVLRQKFAENGNTENFTPERASKEISDFTGINSRKIRDILIDYLQRHEIPPPLKTRKKIDTFGRIDEFTKDAIRRKVM